MFLLLYFRNNLRQNKTWFVIIITGILTTQKGESYADSNCWLYEKSTCEEGF